MKHGRTSLAALSTWLVLSALARAQSPAPTGYAGLVAVFDEWRAFERPSLADGAPDYSAPAMARKLEGLKAFKSRLAALSPVDVASTRVSSA